MTERALFVRAQIMNELPSGKVQVAILADNADGIRFYTNPEHVLSGEAITADYNKDIYEKIQFIHGIVSTLSISGDERDQDIANLILPKLQSILYPELDEAICSVQNLSRELKKLYPEQDGDEE